MNELVKLVEEINQDVVLSEAYQLFESRMVDLAEKYKSGQITKEEYQRLLEEGWRDWFKSLITPTTTDVYDQRSDEKQHEANIVRRERLGELRRKKALGTITRPELKELTHLESMYRRRSIDIVQTP